MGPGRKLDRVHWNLLGALRMKLESVAAFLAFFWEAIVARLL